MTLPRICPLAPLGALALCGILLAGCTPPPEPKPTPTAAFASEEEAFAAAEETYRAYVNALNQVDFADTASFEPVFTLLTASAESSTRKTFSEFHATETSTSGATDFDSFKAISADTESGAVSANLCLDVSAVDVKDQTGKSMVSPERINRQPLLVEFEISHATKKMAIASAAPAKDFQCDS